TQPYVWAIAPGTTAAATIDPSTGVLSVRSVGTVVVLMTRAGDDHYQDAVSAPHEITVNARPITIETFGSKDYDGNPAATGASAAIASGSLAAWDSISFVIGDAPSAAPGFYSGLATATIVDLTTAADHTGNYAITRTGGYTIHGADLESQPEVSSGSASVTQGDTFLPAVTGGAGAGDWQMRIGSGAWVPLAPVDTSVAGQVSFWVRRLGDAQYAPSNEAGPYTLTIRSAEVHPQK